MRPVGPDPLSQDWAVAAREGADVPEVNLAWCCRYMSEMELVGECLPSVLASAGSKKDTHFSMSLYCSSSKVCPAELLLFSVFRVASVTRCRQYTLQRRDRRDGEAAKLCRCGQAQLVSMQSH